MYGNIFFKNAYTKTIFSLLPESSKNHSIKIYIIFLPINLPLNSDSSNLDIYIFFFFWKQVYFWCLYSPYTYSDEKNSILMSPRKDYSRKYVVLSLTFLILIALPLDSYRILNPYSFSPKIWLQVLKKNYRS